jgi:hypothetical protein
MSDKKLTYGKGLNALKKKFNTGGRVNARRGGIKEFTGFQQIEQMGEVIQTPEPKKATKTSEISDLFKPLQQFDPSANNKTGGGLDLGQRPTKSYRELGGTEAEFRPINDLENPEYSETSRRQTLQSLGLTQKQIDAAISSADLKSGEQPRKNNLNEMPDWGGPSGMEQSASFSQSPRSKEGLQTAQSFSSPNKYGGKYPKTSKTESDNTSFNTDIDLSTKPQRGDYGPGKKGYDEWQEALKVWENSLATGEGLYRTGDDEDSSSDKDAEKDSDVRTDQFIDENNNGIDDRDENTEELNLNPNPQLGWQYTDTSSGIASIPMYWNPRTGKYQREKPTDVKWDELAEENAVRIDGGDRGSDNPVTGGSGGSNSGGNMTGEEKKKAQEQATKNREARQGRIESYETDLASARKGTLTEDSKAKDPEKILDAGKGTKIGIAGTIPEGYSLTKPYEAPRRDEGKTGSQSNQKRSPFDNTLPPAGYQWAYKGTDRIAVPLDQRDAPTAAQAGKPTDETVSTETASVATLTRDVTGKGYEAAKAGDLEDTKFATGTTGTAEAEGPSMTERAKAAERDSAQEQEAMSIPAADRPEYKEYATAARDDTKNVVGDVEGPAVERREGITITDQERDELRKIAQGRGVALEDLQEYQDLVTTKQRQVQQGTAAQKGYTPRLGETPRETAARAETYGADYTPQGGNTEIDATPAYAKAATRVAQVGVAAERIASELGTAPSVDFKGREAITGTAPQGDASQIGGVPTMAAASRNAVTGKERKVAAADMMAVIADIPENVTAAISEDPATVEAQIDSGADPQVTAAVAALPQEALVSVQMENLLAGMEDGETPAWARPAVAAIEQQMAQRGLSASTVGRDALFNAIIQSALPMAQSNAQALQQRAQQNLSNQQQANLASAQNTMTVRMQNLANRQTAASQTASMAQEIKVQQGSFKQQATITSAQQEQQTEMATFQAAQQKAQQESAQRQQAAIAELNTNAQMDLANLQAMNAADSESMSAEQQARLTGYNAQIAKVMRQADLKQDMEKANLNSSLQLELSNLSEMNAAAKDTMTAENQEKLTNLQTLVEFRKGDAQFAQQMDMANMSNEQQIELAMLQDRAATDSANFTADNQFRMQELNQKVARSVRQAELNQRMEEVNLDSKLKIELSELAEKNTTSRANMTAEQQTRLANLNVLVDFRKTNAAMAQQMDLANLGNEQQMELANLAEKAATDSANMTAENRLRSEKLNQYVQTMSQNEQLLQQADLANLSMEEKISLANLSEKNKAASESMSAENVAELQRYEKQMGAAQLNANLAQQMGLANLSNEQQASMFNAQIDANLDMKQFDANQQMAMANSQFMKSMTVKDFDARQQEAMQNATALASMDLAAADQRTKLAITNAQNFLQMDMANLNNEQQALIMDQQLSQQRLLSDQSAENIARQFGAKSQQDVDLFMANVAKEIEITNTAAINGMKQFNANSKNAAEARDADRLSDYEKFNASMKQDMSKFNEQARNNRDAFNATNAAAVEAADIADKRRRNEIDTATTNAINMQNASNSFKLSTQSLAFLNQEMRDQADYEFKAYESAESRAASIVVAALGAADNTFDDSKWTTNMRSSITLLLDLIG